MTRPPDVRSLAAAAGLSLRQLALRFEIPYRTVQDWAASRRQPPPYVLRLLEAALIAEQTNERSTTMIDTKYYKQAVELMDDEIREEMHREGAWETEEEFLREYERRHLAKYGKEFTV